MPRPVFYLHCRIGCSSALVDCYDYRTAKDIYCAANGFQKMSNIRCLDFSPFPSTADFSHLHQNTGSEICFNNLSFR